VFLLFAERGLVIMVLALGTVIIAFVLGIELRSNVGCGTARSLNWPFRNSAEEARDLADARGELNRISNESAIRGLRVLRVRGHRLYLEDPAFKDTFIGYRSSFWSMDGGPHGRPSLLLKMWSKLYVRNHPGALFNDLSSVYVLGRSGSVASGIYPNGCI
jgi:hypothetical protein